MNPKSRLNLKPPWKPGQTGNPKGYSANRRTQDMFQRYFKEHPDDEMEMMTALFAAAKGTTIIDKETGKARNPADIKATRLILEYWLGKAVNHVAISGMSTKSGDEGRRFDEILDVSADDPDNT